MSNPASGALFCQGHGFLAEDLVIGWCAGTVVSMVPMSNAQHESMTPKVSSLAQNHIFQCLPN